MMCSLQAWKRGSSLGEGDAEHLADHRHGEGVGERVDDVDLTLLTEAVDEVVDDPDHVGPHRVDVAGPYARLMSKAQVTSTIIIAAAPSVIFAIVADPRQHSRIDGSGTVHEVIAGPDRLVLGSEFGVNMKNGVNYKMNNTVVEYEEDRLIAWRTNGPHRWRYELESLPGGTQVTETWDVSRYPAPGRAILRALFARRTKRSLDVTLEKLKTIAELDAANGGDGGSQD